MNTKIHFSDRDGFPICWSWVEEDQQTKIWTSTEVPGNTNCLECGRYTEHKQALEDDPDAMHTLTVIPENIRFIGFIGGFDLKALQKAFDKSQEKNRDLEAIVDTPRLRYAMEVPQRRKRRLRRNYA